MKIDDLNIASARRLATLLFPHLMGWIRNQFFVPQIGPHHKEGAFLGEHLKLAIENLKKAFAGEIMATNQQIRTLITEMITKGEEVNSEIICYLMLHDIGKVDRLLITTGSVKEVEVPWNAWALQNPELGTKDGKFLWMEEEVTRVSYFHPSKGPLSQHGAWGAEIIARDAVPKERFADIIKVISIHENGYMFEKENPGQMENMVIKHNLSDRQLKLFIACTYLDASASEKENGADMSRFMNLANSYLTYMAQQQTA